MIFLELVQGRENNVFLFVCGKHQMSAKLWCSLKGKCRPAQRMCCAEYSKVKLFEGAVSGTWKIK